jgi:hypothetical protein
MKVLHISLCLEMTFNYSEELAISPLLVALFGLQ